MYRLLLLLPLALGAIARADVIYAYTGGSTNAGTTFTLTTTDFLRNDERYDNGRIDGYAAPAVVSFTSTSASDGGIALLEFSNRNIRAQFTDKAIAFLYEGSPTNGTGLDVTTAGTYMDAFGDTLRVSATPALNVTPEPSSFVLLGSGVLGVAGVLRRRLRA